MPVGIYMFDMYDALCLKRDFEARGDGETDDHKAIMKWWQEGMETGLPMYMERGHYVSRTPLHLDVAPARDYGFLAYGVGLRRSVIELASIDSASEVPFKIYCSDRNCGKHDQFYQQLQQIGIVGRRNGPVAQLGEDNLCDPLNSFFMEKCGINNDYVLQPREEDRVVALRVNFACQGVIDVVANCGQQGDEAAEVKDRKRAGAALEARQMQFTRVYGSYSNARHGVRIVDGYTYGNHFDTLNLEEDETCLFVDSPYAHNNKFTTGTFVGNNGIDFRQGTNNVVEAPNQGLYEGGCWIVNDVGYVEALALPAIPLLPRFRPRLAA